MTPKLSQKYRNILFALMMSLSTGLIVSGVISLIHHTTVYEWLSAFGIAWPIVFLSIIAIAPRISQFVDEMVKES